MKTTFGPLGIWWWFCLEPEAVCTQFLSLEFGDRYSIKSRRTASEIIRRK
ncbi:MAG: hypothetical protein SAL70_44715 [Scytonema sp. PMC 1070.18]|nr:hypothetical protein [Scytonema sp. PMC 1070.18]